MNATSDTNTEAQAPATPDTPKADKPAKKAKAKKGGVKASATKAEKKKAAKKGKSKKDVPAGTAALKQYAPDYHKDNEKKTAGGNTSVDNDDEVARKFRGKDLDTIYGIVGKALAPDVTEADLRKKYKHLNVGMQRMNLGNRYRAALNAK